MSDDGDGGSSTTIDPEATVWDFRTPLTAVDLGSRVDEFRELPGPATVQVVFPSGRTVAGTWEFGAIAEAGGGANPAGSPARPITQVVLLDAPAESPDELRALAERFTTEWGTAERGDESIGEFLDGFAQRVDAAGGEIRVVDHTVPGSGSTIRAFTGATQDGVTPSWSVRVVPGAVTVRTTLAFEPAPAG